MQVKLALELLGLALSQFQARAGTLFWPWNEYVLQTPRQRSGVQVVLTLWWSAFLLFQKRRLLVSFHFFPFVMTSGILYGLLFGARYRPFSSDSFPCFKGMILILKHLIPCLWFRHPSLQLSLSLVIKACSFLSLPRSAYFYRLWWGVWFSFLFERLIFPVLPKIVELFMVKLRPL